MTHAANEEKKKLRRSISTSVSKSINFDPGVIKMPEYYQNVCHEELEVRKYHIKE